MRIAGLGARVFAAGMLALVARADAQDGLVKEATEALTRAGALFRDELGLKGTYVWKYSADGSERYGEGGEPLDPSVGWVQPPGTPAIGAAFLRIYQATGDKAWLEAARPVAKALVDTQLISGGWHYLIETDPEKRRKWCYRSDGITELECDRIQDNKQRRTTVLDDNNTQSVLEFLMWFGELDGGADPATARAVEFGLQSLLRAQYPIGAFSSTFDGGDRPDGPTAPKGASFPTDWSRTWVKPGGQPYYIVNDNLPRDVGRLFLSAFKRTLRAEYLSAAMKLGDFLLRAQMPKPQRGWAQQYDGALQPVWGRKFEPPAIASRETAASIDYLVELHQATAKSAYLEAAREAAAWLRASRLPDGTWARYYELKGGRPLYINNQYEITYSDEDLLDHYGMKGEFGIEATLERLNLAEQHKKVAHPTFWSHAPDTLSDEKFEAEVRALVDSQNPRGGWLRDGWIFSQDFVDAVFVLSRYVETGSRN